MVCNNCYNEFACGMGLADGTVNEVEVESYMSSLKEQSDAIRYFLENEAMTQSDMNVKSQELYTLWDDALNYLWGELQK